MRVSRRVRRVAISELFGALIMIAITLVAGTAALGWIFSQSGTSESSYGNSVAANVNFLNERFTLVSLSFNGTGPRGSCQGNPGECTLASFWLYNTGSVDFTLSTIQVKNLSDTPDRNYVNIVFQCQLPIANCSQPTTIRYTAYNKGGSPVGGCLPGIGGGFAGFVGQLKQGFISSPPYQITMPNCPPTGGALDMQYLFDGTTYTVTLTGLYGNTVVESFTPNG